MSDPEPSESQRLQRRYEREHAARREAEIIAERVTGELYETVQELRRLNGEIERANKELEAANQTLRDFGAMTAHDLRSPVTAILGFASTTLAGWDVSDDAQKQEYLRIIEERARHMTRMLDSLLTVSRIELGAVEVHREEIEVAGAIRIALEDITEPAGEVEVRCPPGLLVTADLDHLRRILVNYISNAFKYGAPPVVVEVRDDGRHVEVAVADHGDGVPADFTSRLFHKFARAADHGTHGPAGTGLGLSIVQGLARANNGHAWYTPNVPRGARFAVRLLKASAA